jgi:superfamily II DNA helicase RecQ
MLPDLQPTVLDIARRSAGQLATYDDDRVQKAAAYFQGKLRVMVESLHGQLPALIGQSKETAAKADELINWLMARIKLLERFAVHAFSAAAYLEILNQKKAGSTYLKVLNALPNEELYQQLLSWRETTSGQLQVMPNMILSEKTAATIAEKLPATLKVLSGIKGVGPQKAAQFGAAIIGLIRAYEQGLQGTGTEQVSLF